MRKTFCIAVMLVGFFAVEAIAQSDSMPAKNSQEPLPILDGKITTPAKVKQLGLSAIKGIWIVKDKNFPAKYGEAGRNGVVFISTRNTELLAADTAVNTQPLILLDSVEIDADSIKKLPPANIDNVQVFKDKEATNRYGIKAAKGLVLVTSKNPVRLVSLATATPNKPLLLVDGIEKDIKELEEIKPERIQSIDVLKGAVSTAIYGVKGTHGVILVTTNSSSKPNLIIRDAPSIDDPVLFIVDGKPLDIDERPKIAPAQISKIEVLKGGNATQLYGERASRGVIFITTKNKKKQRIKN